MNQTNHPNFQLNLTISDKEKRNTFLGGKSVKIVLPPFYEESTLPDQTPFQKGLSMQDSKQEVKKIVSLVKIADNLQMYQVPSNHIIS